MKLTRTAFFTVAAIAIITSISLYLILIKLLVPQGWNDTGVFGDSFGGLNAIFSALAFVAVIYSLRQQSEMIQKQDKEIADNKHALDQQLKTQNLDRFENTFFRILQMVDVLSEEITANVPNSNGDEFRIIEGAEAITNHYNLFDKEIAKYKTATEENRVMIASKFSDGIYNKGFRRYLDHLLSVHGYVVSHKHLTSIEKRFYINILSRSLSPKELILYYYFYVVQLGSKYSDTDSDIFATIDHNLLSQIEHYKYYANPNWLG